MMHRALVSIGLAVSAVVILSVATPGADPAASTPDAAAVERTRDTIKLLDNVYKNAVVLITETYVQDESDVSAGTAAVELFKRTAKDGSHVAKLLDVTGMPYDEKNVAGDDFEREGVKRLKKGEAYYEQIVVEDGQTTLRAMTAIPVVMEKCVMCHPHYKNVKEGAAIGALSYRVPVK